MYRVGQAGEIPTDSVDRFKGEAAPCIELTEIEFAQLGKKFKVLNFCTNN